MTIVLFFQEVGRCAFTASDSACFFETNGGNQPLIQIMAGFFLGVVQKMTNEPYKNPMVRKTIRLPCCLYSLVRVWNDMGRQAVTS